MRIDVFGRDARIALIVASAAVTVAPELATLTILSDCSSDDGASGRQFLAGDLARGHATAGDYYFPEAGSRLMLVGSSRGLFQGSCSTNSVWSNQGFTGFLDDRPEPLWAHLHDPQHFEDPYVVFRELDSLHRLYPDSEIPSATRVSVQDCAIVHHAPRVLTPDIIRSEVVANSDGNALALEPEERRVPMALVRAAPRNADFGVCE